MDKKRIEITITVILIVVFILAWANTFKFFRKKARPVSAPSLSALSTPAESGMGITVKTTEEVSHEKNLEWVRCPFSGKIYSGKEGGPIDLKLTGIVWDEKKPQALINDSIVKEGDLIGRFRVIKIFKDKVQMGSDNGAYFEIRLSN